MSNGKLTTVDFETRGIKGRPLYPPEPVGVSIKPWGKKAKYWAWGHATKNNCSKKEAVAALREVWKGEIICQNGKFDVDIAEVHCRLPLPAWNDLHDTMFLLFLDDPNQRELGLKPSAARLLGMPPDEQNELEEWMIKTQPVPGVKLSISKESEFYWMGYLDYAPGDLVGRYANGDTERTEALYRLLRKKTADRTMELAYQREQKLMLILLEMERQGVPVNLKKLRDDVRTYGNWFQDINLWVIKRLKCDPAINFDSGVQLVNAMIRAKVADPSKMPLTKTGKYKSDKDSLLLGVTDKVLLAVLKYRSQLKTCLNTFMKPWLATALLSKGLIYTTWNQTKQPSGGDNVGTRTGRLSSTPNFQNIPQEFKPNFAHEKKGLPKCPLYGLPALPQVRSYILPFKGHVLIDRDYSQQEPRILAHFEGGDLLAQYVANPWIDFHDNAQAELAKVGLIYERKPVKNTNLGLIYGMGVAKLAAKNDMGVEEAGDLKKAILRLYPGLEAMYKDMKARARARTPIRTWGGREYYCEPPAIVEGRMRQFDYKMVNTLIQGSAADCTKEAIIRYHAVKHKDAKILLNVHDQITVSVPRTMALTEMEKLRRCMESVEFDLPILSEGSISNTHWDALKPFDKKGKIL